MVGCGMLFQISTNILLLLKEPVLQCHEVKPTVYAHVSNMLYTGNMVHNL